MTFTSDRSEAPPPDDAPPAQRWFCERCGKSLRTEIQGLRVVCSGCLTPIVTHVDASQVRGWEPGAAR